MLCPYCQQQETKYRCPKCSTSYCSIACFKSEAHKAQDEQSVSAKREEPKPVEKKENENQQESEFDRILQDPQIQQYLKEPALQFHLLTLIKILQEQSLTGEHSMENRRAIMNMKLNDLRAGGCEENVLVEDFIQRVLEVSTNDS